MTILKWILPLLIVSSVVQAKTISKKDIKLDLPKISDGSIEIDKVEHHEKISAVQITLKKTRTKNDGTSTYYFLTVKDAAGNILKEIDTFGMPKEAGTKERDQIPISSLPDDLTLPITLRFKVIYLCTGDVCKVQK